MTDQDKETARKWYGAHRPQVNMFLRTPGAEAEPTGFLAGNPDLWMPMHWRWFMIGEVAKQIGVKV